MENDPAITKYPSPICNSALTPQEKIALIAEKFTSIMEALGLDLNDPSIKETPLRVAKMYVEEIFSGLDYSNFPESSFIPDQSLHEPSLVCVKTTFTSFCEHHFVPMRGKAYIAYLPHKKIIGLSHIPKIVRYFARRPQVQERLTAQIGDSLIQLLETQNVAISLVAEHYCVIVRGVENEDSHMVTNKFFGRFEKEADLRQEFFESINRNHAY